MTLPIPPRMSVPQIDALVRARLAEVVERVIRGNEPLVVIDSPPGAGKTWLVETLVGTAVLHAECRVIAVAPQNEQVFDLIRRMRQSFPRVPIQAFLAEGRALPDDLQNDTWVQRREKAAQLTPEVGLVVGTVSKLAASSPDLIDAFGILICDEAYQVTFADMAPLVGLAAQVVAVGDPGQLDPVITIDTRLFEAAKRKVHWPAPRMLLRDHPEVVPIQLPATRRLPQDTVDVIQPSFYPALPFVSAADPALRRVAFRHRGIGSPLDRALDLIADGATLVGVLLSAESRRGETVDAAVAHLAGSVAERLLHRGAEWIGERVLQPADIGYLDAHVSSGEQASRSLKRLNIPAQVGTPEVWQGLQRPVMIAKHPLSGLARPETFDLEAGRWCVMLSRHQLACIIVGRDGVQETLQSYRHNCGERMLTAENREWRGWRAHQRVWQLLEEQRRLIRV